MRVEDTRCDAANAPVATNILSPEGAFKRVGAYPVQSMMSTVLGPSHFGGYVTGFKPR